MSLGRGAFSEVVVDKTDSRKAVKIIYVDDQRPPHNWQAEVAALRQLQENTHVVPILDVIEDKAAFDPKIMLIMPRYQLTLEQVIYRKSKANWPPGSGWRNVMRPKEIKTVLLGLALALSAVHEQGIIHRDIKPENILFRESNDQLEMSSLVLIDFGISFVPAIKSRFETIDDKVSDVATGEYKAPELLYGLHNYCEKVDIWALGCIAGRLLSHDSAALFTPYSSDLGLVAAQFALLGRPQRANCPSLQGTAAESMMSTESSCTQISRLALKREPNDLVMQKLFTVTKQILDYEPTLRPTAAEIVKYLRNI